MEVKKNHLSLMSLRESLKKKKVIIFDLDGTIVDLKVNWNELKRRLEEEYFNIYGEICSFDSISEGLTCLREKENEKKLNTFFNKIREYELRNIEENDYLAETIYFINHLEHFGVKDQVKLVVFSLNTRATILKSLEMANIEDKFDLIIGREDVNHWKPEPEGLNKIKQTLKVNREEMIYFGNMKKDLLAGERAGVETHLIGELINYVKNNKP